MRRYVETLLHYWLIAIIPVIVLPIGGLLMMKSTPTVYGSANIWVDQSSLQQLAYVNPGVPPSQNMASYMGQLLFSPSFDWHVAIQSPLYIRALSRLPFPHDQATTDMSTNAAAISTGPNLVTVTYVSKNPVVATQIVAAILKQAAHEIGVFNQQQVSKDISYYSNQLKTAHNSYDSAAQQLSNYMSNHNISSNDLALKQLSDPKLATLYQAAQASQTDVTNIAQQLSKARTQESTQTALRIIDPPASKVTYTSKKKQITTLIIPLVLGLLLSATFIVVKTVLDRSLHYPEEVPDLLGLPVLAVVPSFDTAPAGKAPRRLGIRRASAAREG